MQQENKAGYGFLLLGLLAGLGLALYSLLATQESALPEGAVARVGDRYIGQEDYARALSAVVIDSEQPLSPEQRRRILNRLIDEELLIQYGQDQGLVRSDRRVRANLVSAVIAAKSIAAETRNISDAEARDFYNQNAAYFSRPQQLQVTVLRLPDDADAAAAKAAWAAGASLDALQGQYGAQQLSHVPASLLPVGKLRQLVGASLTAQAEAMPAGVVSAPVEINGRLHLLRVEQRVDAPVAFEQVVEQVKTEMRRREAEQALRAELDALRDELNVQIAEERL
ncbi:MAG: peptidylprolyl isomerase [Salinisphaeraceae bacterium]|nr:peptidylprolyl isomerase [Salinisphaeraceae bacterium]